MFLIFCGYKNSRFVVRKTKLSSETVQSTSLPLQSVDDVHSSDSLSLGVLGVGYSVTDDILKEDLQYTSGLFVDESRDTFYTTSSSQTTDCWFGNTLDVISQDFSVALGTSFSKSFTSFSSSRHVSLSFDKSKLE